ncbi:MAG: DotA/TraY family protein [Pseudomonadota bacterium]
MRSPIQFKQVSGYFWFIFILGLCAFFPTITHAQGVALQASGNSGFFTPASNDQSIIYLGELFGNIPPVLAGTGSGLMGKLFGIFNTAVMSLGILFAGYTTFVGILNTAGEGEMLGKGWSSIWVPIRTVAGIALLIPTASGYCVIQIFMMWLLVQGIGAADSLTSGIIDYMESGQKVYVPGNVPNPSGGTTVIKTWDGAITNVYEGLSCMQALQKNYPLVNAAYVPPPVAVDSSDPAKAKPAKSTTDPIYYNFVANKYTSSDVNPTTGTYDATQVSCGSMKFDNNTDEQKKINPYLQQGLEAIMPSLNAAAYFMVNDTGADEETVMQNTFNFVGSDFMNQVANTYNSYVIQARNALSDSYKNGEYLENIRSYGWISIGNLYWDMAKMSSGNEVDAGGVVGTPAKLPWISTDPDSSIYYAPSEGSKYDIQTEKNLSVFTYGNEYGGQFMADLESSRDADNNDGNGKFHTADSAKDYSTTANGLMSAMTLAVLNNMVDRLSDSTESPMIAAQGLGHHILYDVEALITAFMILQTLIPVAFLAIASAFAAGWGFTYTVLPLMAMLAVQFTLLLVMPLVFVLYGTLMTLGGILAVIIPLIPALAFFLAAVAWMVATVETIVAAPIVAIGLIHPEGHQVMGKAEPALMLMTNMFLRPSLMVMGMAAGVLLSFISVQFVNFGYSQALASILGDATMDRNSSVTWIEATMFLITYVGLILACVNKSFSTIDALPDTVMRWIQGGEGSKFGGGQEAMQKLQGSQESAGQKASGDTASSSQEAGQATDKTLDKAEKAAKQIHDNSDKDGSGSFKLGGGLK